MAGPSTIPQIRLSYEKRLSPRELVDMGSHRANEAIGVGRNRVPSAVVGTLRPVGLVIDKVVITPVEITYNVTMLQANDLLDTLGRAGIGSVWLERPLDDSIVREKKEEEMISVQDGTTESEDIASTGNYIEEDPFLSARVLAGSPVQFAEEMEMLKRGQRNQLVKEIGEENIPEYGFARMVYYNSRNSLAILLMAMGITDVGEGLWNTLWVEGIGSMGNHSEDKRSANITFGGRWARGNMAILNVILGLRISVLKKSRALPLPLFWATGLLRHALGLSPIIFCFLGVDPVIMSGAQVFAALVLSNYLLTMTTFIYSQRKRGHRFSEIPRSMLLEYINRTALTKAGDEGLIKRKKTAFEASPKKNIRRERVPLRTLKAEMFYATVCTLAVAKGLSFSYMLYQQTGSLLASVGMLPAVGWAALDLTFNLAALFTLNRGVTMEGQKGALARLGGFMYGDYPTQKATPRPQLLGAYYSDEGNASLPGLSPEEILPLSNNVDDGGGAK